MSQVTPRMAADRAPSSSRGPLVWLLAALLAPSLAACGAEEGNDGANPVDAATAADAIDDGLVVDAGGQDAGNADTAQGDAPELDAGEADATGLVDGAAGDGAAVDSAGDDYACQGGAGCDAHTTEATCKAAKCNWTDCEPTKSADEVCDGVDNDCDGTTDVAAAGAKLALCDDGDACNGVEACVSGACKTTATACDDNNPCTDDTCDGKTGCQHTNNTQPCSDGDACTGGAVAGAGKKAAGGPKPLGGDTCQAGKCVGGPKVVCNDNNPCTSESCDSVKGCVKVNLTATCSDNNPCTVGDKCSGGSCGGGANKCNDNNVCTTDSCDTKTGACKNTAIPGCKACSTSTQCNDSNACTKDTCVAKKCAHTKISGCVGPTDYEIVSIKPKVTPVPVPGALGIKLTVKNEGKRYTGTYSGSMSWNLYLSVDNQIDAADKKLYGTKWKGYNVGLGGINAKTESFVEVNLGLQDPTVVKGIKFVCVRLSGGGDKNLANNDKCQAITFQLPNFKALSLTAPKNELKAGSATYVGYSLKNLGAATNQLYVQLWMSEDTKVDAKDIKVSSYGYKTGAVGAGATKTVPSLKIYLPKTAQASHKYLCLQVNTYLDRWKTESDPNDNVMCTPIKILNLPNVNYSDNQIYFRSKANKNYGNVPWGGEYTCGIGHISNSAYGTLKGTMPIRCWLGDTAGWNYTTPNVAWKTTWDWTASIGGNGAAKTVLGTTYAKLRPKTMGVKYVCADINHDKKVAETDYNNRRCRKITVTGTDMILDPDYVKLGAAKQTAPQPSVMTRGQAMMLFFGVCNMGNVTLANANKTLRGRVLLSKDAKPSADDLVLKSGFATSSKFSPYKGYGKFHCGWMHDASKKITIPTSVAPGGYVLIFDLNFDQKVVEPMHNNMKVVGVTVK